VKSYGLTKNPLENKLMLVFRRMDVSLSEYISVNHNKITWKTKLKIIFEVVKAICRIHEEKYVLRDLHSGNILYSQSRNDWCINDLKFCSPVTKPLYSIYGKLPYIAPEVIDGYNYSFKSDIYSLAIIMWELALEQSPLINYDHDHSLAISIANGLRPKLSHVIPIEIKALIAKCWDHDPNNRPDSYALRISLENISKLSYQEKNLELWNSTLKKSHSQYYF
jgi:serine/threonine protein kinase